IGVGGEGVYFRGVDTQTGQLVEAHYAGATLGAGATPATVGAGTFGFTGPPTSLSGWSIGAQGSSAITGGVSIAEDGSALHFYGANTSLSVNVAGGYTYSVSVDGEYIYYFGEVTQIPDFSDSTQVLDALNNLPGSGHPDNRTVNFTTEIEGSGYSLRQSITKAGDALIVNTYVVDGEGNIITNDTARGILADYGSLQTGAFSGDVWARQFYASDDAPAGGTTVSDFYSEIQECFSGEVPIDMWPLDPDLEPGPDGIYDQDTVRAKVWKKPIELIEVGDLVVSFDDNDNLVPGPVTRTFQNDAKILLDFFGTRVTPGHVYYRPDSNKSHKFETLIDVLRDDGVIQHQDGTLIRAATNVPVGDLRDGFVKTIAGTRRPDGSVDAKDQGRIRLGTRFLVGEGKERKAWDVADLIKAGGGVVGDDELIRVGDSEPMPFHWEFGDTLPKPEDFVLACSDTTLEDIYKAAEWESQGPRLPAPVVLDRGPVQPLKGTALSAMPRNEPFDVTHAPMAAQKPQQTLNRKQRKAMEAKQRKAAKTRKRVIG
ncbi:hypothetical protein, partial [Epibacterium ulvae]